MTSRFATKSVVVACLVALLTQLLFAIHRFVITPGPLWVSVIAAICLLTPLIGEMAGRYRLVRFLSWPLGALLTYCQERSE